MRDLLLVLFAAHPLVSLFSVTVLLYAAIQAVPASFRALRGIPECSCERKDSEKDGDD